MICYALRFFLWLKYNCVQGHTHNVIDYPRLFDVLQFIELLLGLNSMKQRKLLIWACTFYKGYPVEARQSHSSNWEGWREIRRRKHWPRLLRNMPVAPQSTGSAISLTGNPDSSVRLVANILLQGAHHIGSGALGGLSACFLCHCLFPHLEHLDPVAGAAGEKI